MKVKLATLGETMYIIKLFEREKVMESYKSINEVMNERAILISTKFDNLNRLITTTKNDQYLCLVLELAQGIDGGAFAAPERHTPGEPGVWGVAGFRQPRMARGWGGARNLVHET